MVGGSRTTASWRRGDRSAKDYRHTGPGAIILGATVAAPEAALEMREFCVAPLRLGKHVHGVLAVAGQHCAFTAGDADLVASTAEQISLALERYRFLAVVQRQASVDDLTGLYNHRFLIDSLGQQVALAERLGTPLAILMLDIDHFKALNDTHGHHAGDVALITFAQTVLGNVRRADLAARYGGEEFVVLMPNTSAREAFRSRRRSVSRLRRPRCELRGSAAGASHGERRRGGVSRGHALCVGSVCLADDALYQAKRAGRDRTCMAAATRSAAEPRASTAMLHDAHVNQSEGNAGARSRRSSE